jgi:hypothetical protein
MNGIIYLVGLVVVILAVLSFFGFVDCADLAGRIRCTVDSVGPLSHYSGSPEFRSRRLSSGTDQCRSGRFG